MRKFSALLLTVAAIGVGAANPASAAITITITQNGADVVTAFSGSFNLTGLALYGPAGNAAARVRANGTFYSGAPAPSFLVVGWSGITGPANLGSSSGTIFTATSAYGDPFGFNGAGAGFIFFDEAFTSGGSVSGGSVFAGATLASLGLAAGTYVYTAPNDTLTFQIGAGAVPEPASWAMLLSGFGLTGAALRRRRRAIA